MIAYKGFHPGLICRGYQFVMGLNVTEKANCAANGFHCAENPLDCLIYYPQMELSEYYLVDAGGDVDEDEFDTKISCTQLTILHKLTRKCGRGIHNRQRHRPNRLRKFRRYFRVGQGMPKDRKCSTDCVGYGRWHEGHAIYLV